VGRPVHLAVDDVQPLPGTKVRVVKRSKFPTIQEVVFNVVDRPLSFVLGLSPVDLAEPGSESKVVPKVNKHRMEL